MMIISALMKLHRVKVLTVAAAHFITAMLGLALIVLVHQTLFEQTLARYQATVIYSILLPILFLTGVGSYRMLATLGATTLKKLTLTLAAQVINMSYQQQEAMGATRIGSLLTQDLVTLAEAFRALPILTFNCALLVCCLAYMLWLSPLYFSFYLLVLVIAFVSAVVLTRRSSHLMQNLRQQQEQLNRHFNTLVSGVKELKLNHQRSEFFFENDLSHSTEQLKQATLKAEQHSSIMINWITVLVFVVLGGLLLLSGSELAPSTGVMSGFVIMTLFIRGPIVSIASYMPTLVKGNIVWQQITCLGLSIELAEQSERVKLPPETLAPFRQLSLKQLQYQYIAQGDETGFKLGPLDLTLQAGELIFIIGGNGSGKSTLAKVLTGLYPATHGDIIINGRTVVNLDQLNQRFSSVFFDFHLFEQVLDGQGQLAQDDVIQSWLERLELQGKVNIDKARLSTLKLSQGQRKRLALMLAACEERPLMLFDEWAADQDPHFRAVFYRHLLPYLKSTGKTVIAITHDEHYFDCADKVYRLEMGQLSLMDNGNKRISIEGLSVNETAVLR